MPEMQKAISRLRFLLAVINGKEEELATLARQFQRQLERAPNHSIHGGQPLEATLGVMAEIQERLDSVEKTRRHLTAIKLRAEDELQALDLTNKVEQAKTELAALKTRQVSMEMSEEESLKRIVELEQFIQEASIRAGQAITERFETRRPSGGV